MNRRTSRHTRWPLGVLHDEAAQGVVEFAFVLAFLTLIVLGTADYARFLYYDTAIRSAARVGAEAASNHCINVSNCGISTTAVPDKYVLWATACEAQQHVTLTPSYSSCATGTGSTWDPSTLCNSSPGCTNCAADICVSHPNGSTVLSQVKVSVGYNFTPISPFLLPFFSGQTCYTGDTSGHTLCATAVGRISP